MITPTYSKKWTITIILVLWGLFLTTIVTIGLTFYIASLGVLGEMPSVEQILNPKTFMASQVFAEDERVLGTYFKENRSKVYYQELPSHLVQALIATEDKRFYDHAGIDFISIFRAIFFWGTKGGGSTITQQLAKMLFTENPSIKKMDRVRQKILETIIAIRLEKNYSKEEILTMYLNKFDFLYQAVGIRSASSVYFKKSPKYLNILESAVLVAMAKNPSLYNPIKYPKNSLNRRNLVLYNMKNMGVITYEQYESYINTPIETNFKPAGHNTGVATYFREYIRLLVQEILNEKYLKTGEKYNIYKDGLRIYTTINYDMQKNAEESVKEHLSNLQNIFWKDQARNPTAPFRNLRQGQIDTIMLNNLKSSDIYKKYSNPDIKIIFKEAKAAKALRTLFTWDGPKDTVISLWDSILYSQSILHTGMMAMNPNDGHIKVWVGGIDNIFFQYDHVEQSTRQVGSLFKPFVYATAIDRLKLSPCEKIPNVQILFKKEEWESDADWTPKNADDKYGGYMTLKKGLALSVNTITAALIKRTGPKPVVELAKKMGIKSYLPMVPSLSLGTADISLKEIVAAYATFINKGIYTKPVVITKIEDKNRVVIYTNTNQTKQVLNEETAYIMTRLLEDVTRVGTASRLRMKYTNYLKNCVTGAPYGFLNPIAAKTGTTQNHSDGWFVGAVPDLVTGVWVGAKERAVNFKNIYFGQGATTALPIWALFMKKNYENPNIDLSRGSFPKPTNLSIKIDCDDKNTQNSIEEQINNLEF